ncbi:hypothetical protein D9758_009864 [Tetrapyrgos nigripes]|uniref:Nephrocystin 3-like N-terminal domain-containing protein n=1 Tax=Tetrapyrgos nigripes TaxID=182062 RepID=A0A8H5GN26_9AGAR|nr:hypothetical protein D9758_009864 [Tetrapyrgos nigripes]
MPPKKRTVSNPIPDGRVSKRLDAGKQRERHASQSEHNSSIVPAAAQPTTSLLQHAHDFSINESSINVVEGNQDNRTYHYYGSQQEIINKLNPSTNAFHDVGARTECIEGTRKEILDNIMNWAEDVSSTSMAGYWMCGMAGTGKSTIAQTVCLQLKRKGLLGGEFFCSRQIEECHDYHKVIPTIAYQLACLDTGYRQALCDALNKDQHLASKEPQYQVTKLLVDPWKKVVRERKSPFLTPVIAIDALDECRDISLVLEVLVPAIKQQELPGLKFFLTSRPEQHIKEHFDLGAIQQERLYVQEFYLHNVEKSIVKKDISLFLENGLIGLHISKDKLDILVERSGALFIYAATLVKYLTSGGHRASSRLEKVLDDKGSPDKIQTQMLDELYTQILSDSLHNLSPEEKDQSIKVIHTSVMTGRPVSCQIIADLLGYKLQDVKATISELQSVLYTSGPEEAIYTFHASFTDYITSRDRSAKLHCNSPEHHSILARACLDQMERKLQFNICNLPSSFLCDSEVPGLKQAIAQKLGGALKYSCIFWGYHLTEGKKVEKEMKRFFKKKIVFWMEVMNLIGKMSECIRTLDLVLKRGQFEEIQQRQHTQQFRDMANVFALSAVKEMTPHLYLSILPFYPAISNSFGRQVKVNTEIKYSQSVGYWDTGSKVWDTSISADGGRIVSGSYDGTVRIWDAQIGTAIGEPLQGHEGSVNSVAFSPDGAMIVSGSEDRTVRIWDAQTGTAIGGPLQGHKGWVESVAFSPDGARIVSGSEDRTVRIWDAQTGTAIGGPLYGHEGWVQSVAFSPDGARIVSGSSDRTVRIWDAQTGTAIGEPLQGHKNSVKSVAFSPDGARIVSGSIDETVMIWDAQTGTAIGEPLQGHKGYVFTVAFSPDGAMIVSGSDDRTVRVWDAQTGTAIGEPLQGHKDSVQSVAFSPDGTRIVSGSHDGTVRIWDVQIGTAIKEPLQGHEGRVQSVASSPDGTRIMSGSDDRTVRLWDARTGTAIGEPLQGHKDYVQSVAFSPDGARIVSGSYDRTMRIWDAQTGTAIGEPLQGHEGSVQSVAFSPDGARIVSGSDDRMVRIWDAQTGTAIGQPLQGHNSYVCTVAFSPDGARIVSGSYDRTVRIWDAQTGTAIGEPLQGHKDYVQSVAFSPDGARIVSGSGDRTVRIWDAQTGTVIGLPLQGHKDYVQSVAFSPDGARIVSGSYDRTVRIWDAQSGIAIGEPLQGHKGWVQSVAFSPDGARIVSGSDDRTVRIWDAQNGTAIGQPLQRCESQIQSVAFSPAGNRIVSDRAVTNFSTRHTLSHKYNNWTIDKDGWIRFPGIHSGIVWIQPEYRPTLCTPQNFIIISQKGCTKLCFDEVVYGKDWAQCFIDK